MRQFRLGFTGNGAKCAADVQLNGIADAWTGHAEIIGHPTIKELHITYRLGDFLTPMFGSESEVQFFKPLLKEAAKQAKKMLPKKYPQSLEG